MLDDISFLVNETFNQQSAVQEKPDITGPGLIYKIEKTPLMFVVRAQAFKDLAVAQTNIFINHECYPDLRLESDHEYHCFNTDDFALAQLTVEAIANRRFPFFEEHFLNISDPSMSWWASVDNGKFTLSFKMIHTHEMEKMVKLGPIGNAELAIQTFSKFKNFLGLFFPILEFSHSDHELVMASTPDNLNFKNWVDLFMKGEPTMELLNFMHDLECQAHGEKKEFIKMANYYLLELATTRRLWLEVLNQVS